MEDKPKWSYRKKKDRIIIECDRVYKMVLPKDAEQAYNALILYASSNNKDFASFSTKEEKPKQAQEFAYYLLNEPKNKDAKIKNCEQSLKNLDKNKYKLELNIIKNELTMLQGNSGKGSISRAINQDNHSSPPFGAYLDDSDGKAGNSPSSPQPGLNTFARTAEDTPKRKATEEELRKLWELTK